MFPATIVARSMVTALGADAATSCAAARAGLFRTQMAQGLRFVSSVDGEPSPVVVNAAPLVTRGFEGEARLGRLLARALADVKAQMPPVRHDDATIDVYLSLPTPVRALTGRALATNDEAKEAYLDSDEPVVEPDFAQSLLRAAVAQAGLRGRSMLRHVSLAGHTGGAECLAVAARDLAEERVSLAIVAAVDSLLDEDTLEWLHRAGRLKLADMPVGLRPGEAAACVVLARTSHADTPTFELVGLAGAREERTLLGGATSVGIALADVIAQVAPAAQWDSIDAGAWLVSDHNGEIYRANEWGHASVRLRSILSVVSDASVWTPAESFGDTGAASGLVGACVAMAALERGYAPGRYAVIVSSAETRARSAFVIGSTRARHHAGEKHGRA